MIYLLSSLFYGIGSLLEPWLLYCCIPLDPLAVQIADWFGRMRFSIDYMNGSEPSFTCLFMAPAAIA